MKRFFFSFAMMSVSVFALQAQSWRPAPLKLPTRWSGQVSPNNALKEYPRPQLVREQWQNLNGLWDYAITEKDAATPSSYEGRILVPYPIESALSGVQKMLTPQQHLWYHRNFNHTAKVGTKTLIHFGAVDAEAVVFVNGKVVGKHVGGYTEFSFDITAALKDGDNEIFVRVFDPTDQGVYPHGKQVLNPANIYYTPTSGIWQTVWLETVPVNYISSLKFAPDIDKGVLNISVNAPAGCNVEITALDNGSISGTVKGKTNTELQLPVRQAKLWTPGNPFLYQLQVKLLKGNKIIDEVTSYFGMRKVSVGKDDKGYYRIFLNNKYLFNLGTLDQGFWPDGLYTAPTDEALRYDIEAIKAMGFNTIRKHIKVEPARWYYHADKLGMLVWQDFVNPNQGLPEGAKPAFEKQLNETLQQLHNYPCITTWVLFNEKWGQYNQQRLTEYVKKADPSRLLNAHSGELLWVNEKLRSPSPNAWKGSDIADIHAYPDPMNVPEDQSSGKIKILGEFGGIGVFIPDHQWLRNKSWGYVQVTPAQLLGKYAIMNQHLQLLERDGLAGSIYTQPFDVEGEENGIMTYDREVIKMPFGELRKIHARIAPDIGTIPQVNVKNADLTDPGIQYSNMLQEFIDGKNDAAFLKKLAMMAAQAGDKNGRARVVNASIASLNPPFSEEDILSLMQATKSTSDPGFKLMINHADQFRNAVGERKYSENMMDMIFKDDIEPMVTNVQSPDWIALTKAVTDKYGPAIAGRTVARAKLFFYYDKDWKQFSSAIVAYTELYEDKTDLKILNINANFILQHSDNKEEISKAILWSKLTLEKDPQNAAYKTTQEQLQVKWQKL